MDCVSSAYFTDTYGKQTNLVRVVHRHGNPLALEVINVQSCWGGAILGGVHELQLTRSGGDEVCRPVLSWSVGMSMDRDAIHARLVVSHLVTESVTTDHDWVLPAWDRTGYLFEDDGLTEHGPTKDVTDLVVVSLRMLEKPLVFLGAVAGNTHGAVGALPHLFQFEFLHPGLVRGDGGTFDSDVVLLDGLRRVDRDLVVCLGQAGKRRQFPNAGETMGDIRRLGTRVRGRST